MNVLPLPFFAEPMEVTQLDDVETLELWLLAQHPQHIVGVSRDSRACVVHRYFRDWGVPVQAVSRFTVTMLVNGELRTKHLSFDLFCFITEVDELGEKYAVTAREALECLLKARATADSYREKGWAW